MKIAEKQKIVLLGMMSRMPVAGVVLVLVIAGWLLLRRTRLGIAIYAVGTDAVKPTTR